jgi:8-oxo-dGTP diphosphatase
MRPIRNSAKAIILKDNKVLAIKLRDEEGFWYTLPGGGQEPGESLHQALRRECLEEVNAELEIMDLRFVRDYIGKNHEFADHDGDAHAVEFMFECRLRDGSDVRSGSLPDTGQLAVEWLDLAELDNYRLYPLALRPLIARNEEAGLPVYLGDIN